MRTSFYTKLSTLFLVLLLGVGALVAVLGIRSAQRYADEVEQKLNRTLADELVPRFAPLLRDSIDTAGIEQEIQQLTGINRRLEIYLLEQDGRLKASFAVPDSSIEERRVDTEPIHRFVDGAPLPILGDDPMNADAPKPFSAAPIEIMGKQGCYLYIVLSSDRYASIARMVGESTILRTTLGGLGVLVLLAASVGLALFYRLTRRLRSMQDVVAAFESGNFDARMTVASDDELGMLAKCFNQMADTLVSTLEDLRRSDAMRRELVANVSHDLRSPLASIQGYLETLQIKDDALDPDARQRYVETALKNAQRLNTLVSELFELSKLESNQIEPTLEPFPVAELVQDVVMQHQPAAEQQGVDLAADLPDCNVRVQADIGLVERALSNLIDNAIHYTPSGGRVRVRVRRTDEGVSVAVADTGPGIPDDDLPHIFDRFYRVDKSRGRDNGGAGLGLAIAHTILDLHNKPLEVHSAVGKGTTFQFELHEAG